MNLSPKQAAELATRVFMSDLRLRKGFRELIESIGVWPDIEKAMCDKVESELIKADFTEEIGFE